MTFAAALIALVAAGIHGYIFLLAAVRFDTPVARGVFRIKDDREAAAARPWVYQYGFFHLFLAITIVAGAVLLLAGARVVGTTIVVVAGALMIGTAVLHGASDRQLRLAAAVQSVAPAVAIFFAVGVR